MSADHHVVRVLQSLHENQVISYGVTLG